MPSPLDQIFKHKIYIDEQYRFEIEKYCTREIGYRTYYMSQLRGGKQWRMSNATFLSNKFALELNDDSHAVILSLKYAS